MRLEMTWERNKEIAARLEFLRSRLYVSRTLVPDGYEEYFREIARYRSVANSTAIEGVDVEQDAAFAILVEGGDEDDPNAVQLTSLQDAYQLMIELASDTTVKIDNGLIRTMNSIILRGLPQMTAHRGRFRVGGAVIADSRTREIRYRPPAPELVPELMNGLVTDINGWLDAGMPGPIVAALAHFGLVSIHPFRDGNGRAARLLADTILQITGSSADGMIAVSEVIRNHQQDYYNILRSVQGDDFQPTLDVTAFVERHTDWLSEAASQLEDTVVAFNQRLDDWRDDVRDLANEREVLGVMYVADVGPLSTSTYARLTATSRNTARRDINELEQRGVLARVGGGRNTRYVLSSN